MNGIIPQLTLYVLPGGGPEGDRPFRAASSYFKYMPLMTLHVIDHHELSDFNDLHYTPWFGYIMSNEWIDEELSSSLPVFLKYRQFDCLVLFQKKREGETARVFEVPRIFRSGKVRIQEGSLMPENPGELKYERALNGWIIIE